MNVRVLIFGANGFLAKKFNHLYKERFSIENVYRKDKTGDLHFDFVDDNVSVISQKLTGPYKAVLFFQGIQPSVGAKDMDEDHFEQMLKINLVIPSLLVKELAGKMESGALVLFVSSVARKKGSYDPSYASAKAGLIGLMHSLANAWPALRFNCISPGLIEGSPVFENMTPDFRQKHALRMFGHSFIQAEDVVTIVAELIENKSINRTNIEIDGGYN
ncbi:MAG TPA: SDR family oxidoreductase [Mucilaginibacter sp.]|nr:SDR family oxidoreductase [Mucilaginibacter sp.]